MGVQQRPFRFVQPEEELALGEDGGFRGIDVLGRLLVPRQHPAAEGRHAALFVANWEDEAPAEAVVKMVRTFLAHHQARLFHERQFVILAFGPFDGVVPGVRGVAEPEELHRLGPDAAAGQVIARDGAGLPRGQGRLPALRDLLVDLEETLLQVPGVGPARLLLQFKRYPCPLRQPPNRVGKVQVLVFLDKGEDVAAFVAAEAMENLFVRVDVEAGGLLPVEGAKRDEIGPGAFERHITSDHLDNVAGSPNLFERRRRNEAAHDARPDYFLPPLRTSLMTSSFWWASVSLLTVFEAGTG